MITAEPVLMPDSLAKPLRVWLDKPELKTLIRVAEAHQKVAETKAIERAKDFADHPLTLEATNQNLIRAHGYAVFIKVLQEIASQTEFNDVKLT